MQVASGYRGKIFSFSAEFIMLYPTIRNLMIQMRVMLIAEGTDTNKGLLSYFRRSFVKGGVMFFGGIWLARSLSTEWDLEAASGLVQ